MSNIFRFRNFPVYKDTLVFDKEIRKLAKFFPKEEKYGLISQLCRASDSVLLNIAEGSDRYSDQDFSRFLNQSLTSLNEVVACLDIAFENEYIEEKTRVEFIEKSDKIYRQLAAFSSRLRKK
jgi:four helix bundle protein